MLNEDDIVIVRTFNGSLNTPSDYDDNENYWRLIGFKGVVVKSSSEKSLYASFTSEKRVLIRFEKNILKLGLECHNDIENALWFLEQDVEILDKTKNK